MEHGHPGPSTESVSGGAEQEVLLDGHVADERQDEQRHAEHNKPQRAGYAHHPASLRAPAPPHHEISDGPARGDGGHPGAAHPRRSEGVAAEMTRASARSRGSWVGGRADAAATTHGRRNGNAEMQRGRTRVRGGAASRDAQPRP